METNATLLTEPSPASPRTPIPEPDVLVQGTGRNFVQNIAAGDHQFKADEPASFGGTGLAPDPYDYLLASLGACTSMMVGLQARKRRWPLETISVSLKHSRIHAKDCGDCLTKDGLIDRIDIGVELTGPLTDEQRHELMNTAATCPIHRALKGEISIGLRALPSA